MITIEMRKEYSDYIDELRTETYKKYENPWKYNEATNTYNPIMIPIEKSVEDCLDYFMNKSFLSSK
jgi:hypothetical protein